MTEEDMEGPILFWGYKEQESNLILPEHDDDDDELMNDYKLLLVDNILAAENVIWDSVPPCLE